MSFLKSLIFKEETGSPAQDKKQENTPKTGTVPSNTTFSPSSLGSSTSGYTPPPSQTSYTPTDGNNEEFMQVIATALENRNIPGPDYFEFAKALEFLKTKPMDEATKFYSAFAGLNAAGLTKEKLIETANFYISKIDEMVQSFNAEIDALLNSEVANKQQAVDSLTQENEKIEAEMKRLTELRNKNNDTIQTLSIDINKEITSLNMKRAGFDAAAKEYSSNIQKNIQKIQSHITN